MTGNRYLLAIFGLFLLMIGPLAALTVRGAAAARPSGVMVTTTASATPEVTPSATVDPAATPTLPPAAYLASILRDPTPTPTITPSPTPGGIPPDNLAYEQAIFAMINEQRQANALPLLSLDGRLTQSARRHARDMADNNQLSHTGSDGSTAGQRIQEAGYSYSWYGENIGWGFTSPASMMAWWLNSPPHRANILHSQFMDVGVAYGYNGASPYRHHWVLNFGRPAAGDALDSSLIICIDSTGPLTNGGSALRLSLTCALP